jgi:Concanavalin A-like lectin/glucanases superfamily/Immunoglobulin I-set domain
MKTKKPTNNGRSVSLGISCQSVLVLLGMVLLLMFSALPATAQSLYSNAVMSLNPVAYWPLQETNQPASSDVETNLGSLGTIANAYYGATNVVLQGWEGAIAGDSDTSVRFLGGPNNIGSQAIVPTTDNRVSLTAGQPFTVELWTRPLSQTSYRGIISQTGPNNAGGLNGVNASAGWSLSMGFAAYRGTGSDNAPRAFSFHVFNGNGFTGGAEAECLNTNCWLSGGPIDYTNAWVYLACVFDGTNAWVYMYSTNLISGYEGTNFMDLQLPVDTAAGAPVGGPGTQIPGLTFVPDTWDPIQIGCERGVALNPYPGDIDEVAIYTNALTYEQITNHFMAGTNGLGDYASTILAANPYIYWRMDAPPWTPPPASSYPAAMNYGSAASSMVNLNTGGSGADCGVYEPGTVPGVSGPSYGGFGPDSKACAFNGMVGAVDAGYNHLLDPTGVTNNFTLVAWFKGNPMDANNRWNVLASHSDKSWKAQIQNGNVKGYKGVGGQPNIAPTTYNVNDGKWHMYVLESTSDSVAGTNVTVYLDSGAVFASLANTSLIPGTNGYDAFIGGAPEANYRQPTNHATYTSGQQYFAGEICQVAYFTNALTLNQIAGLYSVARPEPLISLQPVSGVAGVGGAYTVSVGASGQQLAYQWYRDGQALPTGGQTNLTLGATNASLVINPVQFSDESTNYFVVVTNIYGSVTSSVVSLSVLTNLAFVAQYPVAHTDPMTLYGGQNVGGTNYLGSTPTFSVSAAGAVPISYQWMTNGVVMDGATNPSLTIANCQMTSPTSFVCVLTNIYGSLTSTVWSVTYVPAPMAPYPQAVLAAAPVGYWRLNEPDNGAYDGNPGAICNDYQSGNNGIYTNVYLHNILEGTGYSPTTDPDEAAAEFGLFTGSSINNDAFAINNVNFSVPAGDNGEFTVAVWANGYGYAQNGNAGLVTKGHWGAEQFTLDEGAPGNDVRFTVRDQLTGGYYSANSLVNLGSDKNWHFVVGVCDQANSQLLLYVDGRLVGSSAITAYNGILNVGPVPMMIGARDTSATVGGAQFKGLLNDAAAYNYAMSADQVASQYQTVGGTIAPYFLPPLPSTNVSAGANTTLTIPVTALGTPSIGYVWNNVTMGATVASGATNGLTLNASLVYSNVPAAWNNNQLELIVTNAYGVASNYFMLTIASAVNHNPTNIVFSVAGNQLTLSWPTDHTGWRLQSQTNDLAAGLGTNWVDVTGSSATNQVIVPIDANNESVFYRLIYP